LTFVRAYIKHVPNGKAATNRVTSRCTDDGRANVQRTTATTAQRQIHAPTTSVQNRDNAVSPDRRRKMVQFRFARRASRRTSGINQPEEARKQATTQQTTQRTCGGSSSSAGDGAGRAFRGQRSHADSRRRGRALRFRKERCAGAPGSSGAASRRHPKRATRG